VQFRILRRRRGWVRRRRGGGRRRSPLGRCGKWWKKWKKWRIAFFLGQKWGIARATGKRLKGYEKNGKVSTCLDGPDKPNLIVLARFRLASEMCTAKDGNGHGMDRVEQYHIHTRIVNGYKLLFVPVPMGINLYPYPYPTGTRTHWVPGG
jgi:hypothetical protein